MKPRYVVQFKGRYLASHPTLEDNGITTDNIDQAQIFGGYERRSGPVSAHAAATEASKKFFGDSFEAFVIPHGEALFAAEGKHNEQIAEQGQQDEDAMRQTDEGYAELRGMA